MSNSPGDRPAFRPGLLLARGVVRHCARCGSGGLFRGYFRLKERCPRCSYRFDREEGFWVGAFVVNFVVAEGSLGVLMFAFIFRLNATQDTGGSSSAPYLAIGLVLAIVVPIIFYPFSKTIWAAIDLILHHGDTS